MKHLFMWIKDLFSRQWASHYNWSH